MNFENFLIHGIDHFELNELMNIQFIIISAKVKCGDGMSNVGKFNQLFPYSEFIINYENDHHFDSFKKAYLGQIKNDDDCLIAINKYIINLLLKHVNIMLIWSEREDSFMAAFLDFLKEEYDIDYVNLDQLFKEGKINSIYWDPDIINDKAVKIRRYAAKMLQFEKEATVSGRLELLKNSMNKKEKIKKLKKLGYKVGKNDNVNELLFDAWIDN